MNKLLYGFIWKGNDKIKRTSLINDIENGGLKMLDIQSMILSQRVIALKRFIEDYNSPWKSVLETFLESHCTETSQRVIALKRFIEDYNSTWKSVLEMFFRFI